MIGSNDSLDRLQQLDEVERQPLATHDESALHQLLRVGHQLWQRGRQIAENRPLWQQILALALAVVMLGLALAFFIFSSKIFAWLEPVAERWRQLPGGWLIIFVMTFSTAFPPIIGYSSSLTIAGFVFGLVKG